MKNTSMEATTLNRIRPMAAQSSTSFRFARMTRSVKTTQRNTAGRISMVNMCTAMPRKAR